MMFVIMSIDYRYVLYIDIIIIDYSYDYYYRKVVPLRSHTLLGGRLFCFSFSSVSPWEGMIKKLFLEISQFGFSLHR